MRATTDQAGYFREATALEVVQELLYVAGYIGDDFEGAPVESTEWVQPAIRSGGVGVTDAEGQATLHLRPGDYGYVVEPVFEDIHLPVSGSFHVGEERITAVGDVKLTAGAVVVLEARDAKTGEGVEGVSFQSESDVTRRRREVRSRPSFVDHPRTDREGRLRAVMAPGAGGSLPRTCRRAGSSRARPPRRSNWRPGARPRSALGYRPWICRRTAQGRDPGCSRTT